MTNWTLQINDKVFNNRNYQKINESEIVEFLSEWNNENDSIIVQTSGSTGTPKKIKLLKSDMIASAKLTGEYFDLQVGQTAFHCLPIKYIAGKMILVRAIVLQLKLIYVKSSSNPLDKLTQKIDFAAMTPMQVKTILKQTPNKLNLIKKLIIGGAPVDTNLENDLQAIKTICYSTYGMTETITHVAVKKLNGKQKNNYFKALPNVTFSKDKRGCLVINTPHLSVSMFTTNDITEFTELESFKLKGRVDNIINSGGIKVQPEAIERKLSLLLKNNRFFIDSLPHKTLGEQLILVIESESEIPNLHSQIDPVLSSFEHPKKTFYISEFSETETGKINRKKTILELQKASL